jgi:hypothetical protein
MKSKKHRRFATDLRSFAELDRMLVILKRPPNPNFFYYDHPACYDQHEKGEPCNTCDLVVGSQSNGSGGETDATEDGSEGSQSATSLDDNESIGSRSGSGSGGESESEGDIDGEDEDEDEKDDVEEEWKQDDE